MLVKGGRYEILVDAGRYHICRVEFSILCRDDGGNKCTTADWARCAAFYAATTDAVCGKTAKQNMDTGQIQLLYAAN
jgi:hypothetical protein